MRSTKRTHRHHFRRTVSTLTLVAFVVSQTEALAGPIADPATPIGFRPSVSNLALRGVVLDNSLGAVTLQLLAATQMRPVRSPRLAAPYEQA